MKFLNLAILALATSFGPHVFAADAIAASDDAAEYEMDSMVTDADVGTELTGAEWLDSLTLQQDQNTDANEMSPEAFHGPHGGGWNNHGGGGWNNHNHGGGWGHGGGWSGGHPAPAPIHHGPGWIYRRCAGLGPVHFCWVKDPNYGHHATMLACYTRNTRTGVTFRSQAPQYAYSAASLQARATAACRHSSAHPNYCVAEGCRYVR